VLRTELDPDVTLGEVVDAAEALGYGQHIGELSLAELADALVEEPEGRSVDSSAGDAPLARGYAPAFAHADEDEDEDDEIEDDEDDEDERAPSRGPAKAKPAKAKPAKAKPAKAGKAKKAAVPTKGKKAAKKARARVEDDDDDDDDGDDRMSLKQATDLLVPIVTKLGKATMEQLERATKLGRRKLRFHVGQLVRHGELARHGMGRGTHYTLA